MPLYRRDQGLKRAAVRGGFILRRNVSPEPAIASISTRGDFVSLAGAPGSPVLLEPIVVRRTGYVMGASDPAPVLTTWDETIRLTKRRITPGGPESNGYVGNDVMTTRVIMAGDTLPNQGGLVNPSTRAAPAIEVRWISASGGVIGNTASAAADCNSFYTRNGLPVAAMAFVWRDDLGGLVRAYARLPVPFTGHGVTGYTAHQWKVDNVDISALAGGASGDGRVRLDWEAYGHYGQLISSSDAAFNALNATKWFHGTQYFRKNAAMAAAPLHAFWRPGVPDASPIASTNEALARSRPFGTWQAARDAAQTANFTAYPVLGGPCLDGVIITAMDTGVGGNVIPASGTNASLSGVTTCRIAGFKLRADPLGTWSPRPVLNGFTTQLSTTTNPNSQVAYTIEGFDVVRTGTTVFNNPSGGVLGNPIPNVINLRLYLIAPAGGGTVDLGTSGIVNLFGNAYGHAYGYTFPNTGGAAFFSWTAASGTAGLYDCVVSNYESRVLSTFANICVRALNTGSCGILGSANGLAISSFMDAVRIEQAPTFTGAVISAGGTLDAPGATRNSEIIVLNSAESNRFSISSDAPGGNYSMRNWFGHHCTIPARAGNIRANAFYTDGTNGSASALRDHQYCGFTNSVLPPVANKGEWFGASNVADVSREPGYREFGYGVGCKGNFYAMHFALNTLGNEIEAQRYPGINCVGTISAGPIRNTGPYANPGYIDPRVPTVIAGANGAIGGDYRHSYTMPAASEADVLFDIAGRAVPLACVRPGAHSGWAL